MPGYFVRGRSLSDSSFISLSLAIFWTSVSLFSRTSEWSLILLIRLLVFWDCRCSWGANSFSRVYWFWLLVLERLIEFLVELSLIVLSRILKLLPVWATTLDSVYMWAPLFRGSRACSAWRSLRTFSCVSAGSGAGWHTGLSSQGSSSLLKLL